MKNTNNYTYQIVEMLQAKLVLTGGVRTQVSPKSTVRHSPPRILPPAAAATPADRQRLHRRTPTRHIHSPRAHPPPASPRAYARAHRTPRTRAHTPEAALTRAPSRLKTRDAERVGRGARPVRSEPAWRRWGQADLELMQFGTLKMLMAQQLQSQADMQVVDWDVVRPSERERGTEREREREREKERERQVVDSDAALRSERASDRVRRERERQVIDSDAARGGRGRHGRQGCSVVDLHTCAREEDRMRRGEGGER